MSAQPTLAQSPPPRLSSSTRVEYLDYQTLPDYREYRLSVRAPEGSGEFRFRIPIAAFAAKRMLLQDGPDVCYQKLLRTLAAGETPSPMRSRSTTSSSQATGRHTRLRRGERHGRPRRARSQSPCDGRRRCETAAARGGPPATGETAPAFDEGQRVSHAIFGVGVTMASSGAYTAVHFDDDVLRTFVTSLLDLEVLSAPHTWETGPRGRNRPAIRLSLSRAQRRQGAGVSFFSRRTRATLFARRYT